MTWDVNKAVTHLKNHAKSRSQGYCAKYVREAIEAGGISIRGPISAKDYGPFLKSAGFTEYSSVPPGGYEAGDVAVIQKPDDQHEHGHMQMYSGAQWISDFKQQDFWPGSIYTEKTPSYKIYRME